MIQFCFEAHFPVVFCILIEQCLNLARIKYELKDDSFLLSSSFSNWVLLENDQIEALELLFLIQSDLNNDQI